MPAAPVLAALSARFGILPSYLDQHAREERVTRDDTRIALLAAMGVDASTESAAREAFDALEEADRRRVLAPVRVVRATEAWNSTIQFRVPDEWSAMVREGGRVAYECELRDEQGEVTEYSGVADRAGEAIDIGLAPLIEPGYYDVRLILRSRGRSREATQRLVLAPSMCPVPARRSAGIVANLYSVRSARNWSVGTLGDLARLAEWSAAHGAAFVGVNPLHALRNRDADISPYTPVSRLYRSAAYLDIEAIPELAECSEARALLEEPAAREELARLRAGDRVEYERATMLARPVLERLYRAFMAGHGAGARGRAYVDYVAREGEALTGFATFLALDEHFGGGAAGWRGWPAAYRVPSSTAVAEFRQSRREAVDFHRWVQFEIDRQLADAAARGRSAGLSVGIYQDLAIGSAAGGSDAWLNQQLFVPGATLGAPPDDYAADGQNWGLPPISPHRLHEERYDYWIALLRASLRHAGALRIDHVLGLFRQFWIPEGATGRDGAYVRFPTNDLLGILALESARHRAIVVGEDLGTVPPEVPGRLREWGILASRVMLFERDESGGFRAAAGYEPLALATADTHDMAPIEGWLAGRDIDLRRELGLIENDEAARAARAKRHRERRALVARLTDDGVLPQHEPATGAELRGAVHAFLCATPALLAGIALDDLTGERDPVNVPGVGADRYPSWTRRMHTPLEDLDGSPDVRTALRCARGNDD